MNAKSVRSLRRSSTSPLRVAAMHRGARECVVDQPLQNDDQFNSADILVPARGRRAEPTGVDSTMLSLTCNCRVRIGAYVRRGANVRAEVGARFTQCRLPEKIHDPAKCQSHDAATARNALTWTCAVRATWRSPDRNRDARTCSPSLALACHPCACLNARDATRDPSPTPPAVQRQSPPATTATIQPVMRPRQPRTIREADVTRTRPPGSGWLVAGRRR